VGGFPRKPQAYYLSDFEGDLKFKSFPYQQNYNLSGSPSFKGIKYPKSGENWRELSQTPKMETPWDP